jgi:predicted Fe-Mo cluster-binding NifX family protein
LKIAISSTGKDIDSAIDPRFGRAAYFIIAEIKNKEFKIVKTIANPNINVGGGAGVSAGQLVANEQVSAVITGNIGPRAMDVFSQLKIEVYSAAGTVKKAIEDFMKNKLQKITMPGPMGIGKPSRGRI